jgi:hypothetical protein
MSDVISGECYRKTVHDLTRELRTAQRLVSQLIAWSFALFGTTIMFALMWAFEFVVGR